jgi:hypothetical protein
LRELRTVASPGQPAQLVFSPKHHLLFVRGDQSVWVVDEATEKVLAEQKSTHKFTDISLSPDESSLFVADYGGTKIGYGQPLKTSYVHQFDLTARKWAQAQAPQIAYRVEAVAADRFLLLEQDQSVKLTLNRWAGGQVLEELRLGCDYAGDIEYDPRNGNIYHGRSGLSICRVSLLQLDGDSIDWVRVSQEFQRYAGADSSTVLSSDGRYIYYGPLQLKTADFKTDSLRFPEVIWAASRDLAFAERQYYQAQTGRVIGALNFKGRAHTVSRDGMFFWTFNPTENTLHQYALEEAK